MDSAKRGVPWSARVGCIKNDSHYPSHRFYPVQPATVGAVQVVDTVESSHDRQRAAVAPSSSKVRRSAMSETKYPRRTVLKGALLGVVAIPAAALVGRAEAAERGSQRAAGEVARLCRGRDQGRRQGQPELQGRPALRELSAGARARLATPTFRATFSPARWSTRTAGARSGSSARKIAVRHLKPPDAIAFTVA